MRTFAEKPKATQQATSPKTTAPARSRLRHSHEVNSILHLQRRVGNQAVQWLLQNNAEERSTKLTGVTPPHFGHHFSEKMGVKSCNQAAFLRRWGSSLVIKQPSYLKQKKTPTNYSAGVVEEPKPCGIIGGTG